MTEFYDRLEESLRRNFESAAAAEERMQPWRETRIVGQGLPRVDAFERVSGKAEYTYDVILPDMVYGAILRCPHAHALVKKINTAAAEKMPGVEIKTTYSTATAAREVAEGDGKCAAIGSAAAAEAYGLDIAVRDIHDCNNNFTRFVVLSKSDSEKTGNDKTSIVFSTEDRPGSLYRILDIFNLWDINMTRIESRPAKDRLGSYIFFVDIMGHREDGDIKDALTMVKRKTSFYKFLGSYPVFEEKRR